MKEGIPGEFGLSRAEIAAVYSLAWTATERLALWKMIAMMDDKRLKRWESASPDI